MENMNMNKRLITLAVTIAVTAFGLAPVTSAQTQRRGSRYNRASLTGTYQLNSASSTDPRTAAETATRGMNGGQHDRIYNSLINRLTPPEQLAIEQNGTSVTMASSRSAQATFSADGREVVETQPNGRTSRVRATLSGDQLVVVTNGDRNNDFTVTFALMNNGRRLRVTRELYAERLTRAVRVDSYYDRTDQSARWDIFQGNGGYPTNAGTNNNGGYPNNGYPNNTSSGGYLVPDGTQLVAVLNSDLSTSTAREGDRFTMTVRSPATYNGAVLEGYISKVDRGGRVSGRSGMTFNFERIRSRNGRTNDFTGVLETVVSATGESARVDTEGTVQESDSRTNTTIGRTAIGTAVGAIIGAIAGGGSGAAIGAAVGAGAGAGSVYVQGRDDLNLTRGTEVTVRASAPANFR
jgi:hypothetical protein